MVKKNNREKLFAYGQGRGYTGINVTERTIRSASVLLGQPVTDGGAAWVSVSRYSRRCVHGIHQRECWGSGTPGAVACDARSGDGRGAPFRLEPGLVHPQDSSPGSGCWASAPSSRSRAPAPPRTTRNQEYSMKTQDESFGERLKDRAVGGFPERPFDC